MWEGGWYYHVKTILFTPAHNQLQVAIKKNKKAYDKRRRSDELWEEVKHEE